MAMHLLVPGMWDASQRARRKDQRIFRSVGVVLGGDVLVQKIQPRARPPVKYPGPADQVPGSESYGSKMDGEDSMHSHEPVVIFKFHFPFPSCDCLGV